MENFIANIKNKLMLPGNQGTKEEPVKKASPMIPMPDIDNMSAMQAPRAESPPQGISDIQNEQAASPEKVPSKSSFNVLVKSFSSSDKKEEEPSHIPNSIEDDIFIYYD